MKTYNFSYLQAILAVAGFSFLAGCNGKIDQDLIDSITGKIPVEKVSIDQTSFTMTVEDEATLTATVLPENASDKSVFWSSEDENVVVVSTSGKAIARSPGSSVITAKAGGMTDIITITVKAKEGPTPPVDPSADFIGAYALDDGTGLTDTYFSFFKGTLSKYSLKQSSPKVVIAEGCLWHTSVDDFSMDDTGEYAIDGGTIYLKGVPYGAVSFSGNQMTLADKTYTRFTDFKSERYSVITVNGGLERTCDYTAQTLSFLVSLRTIPSGKLQAYSGSDWLVPGEYKDGVYSFSIKENNSGSSRSAQVTFSYLEAEPVTLTLTQSYAASSIVLESSSVSAPYGGGNYELSYRVLNPRQDASLSVFSDAAWIKEYSVADGKVVFSVPSSTSICSRSAVIRLTYGLPSGASYATEPISVFQEGNPDFDKNASVSLFSSGTSNSYIVNAAGQYKFPAVKGNSSTSVGRVSYAEVLWESFGTDVAPAQGDVIDAGYIEGYIHCKTPATLNNGNAVVVARDASGTILWSWHIWVCAGYNPASTAQEYYNSAGTMMDRNLGATSATPGDVGALGLLYQWGRKDPFLGSSRISSSTKAKSTLSSWPSPVSSNSSNGTIEYAVAHPTTFITFNSSNYDWYYTGGSSTDNTRWQSVKTIYDPCPPGWRVPDGGSSGVWSKAVNSSSYFTYDWDSTNRGMKFSGKFGSADTIWYPAAGFLSYDDGGLSNVGYDGRWWSCTPDGSYACRLGLHGDGGVYPSGGSRRALGFSVRCSQE